MSSLYKPKICRSTQGCCICKAKYSSSRFTDSKKYETDFIDCFQLGTPRKGEICHACVSLVKRFKRLPPGSGRHWGHVVDARVGPGRKTLTKFKKQKEEQVLQQANGNDKVSAKNLKTLNSVSKRYGKIFKKKQKEKLLETAEHSSPSSPSSILTYSKNDDMSFDMDDELEQESNRLTDRKYKKYQRKSYSPLKNRGLIKASIIDEQFWVRVKTCCGVVYENKSIGAVIVDSTSTLCALHKRVSNPTLEVSKKQPDQYEFLDLSDVNDDERTRLSTALQPINDQIVTAVIQFAPQYEYIQSNLNWTAVPYDEHQQYPPRGKLQR